MRMRFCDLGARRHDGPADASRNTRLCADADAHQCQLSAFRSIGRCPFTIATEKGWWKDVGLAAELFQTFPAGAPQVAAAQAKSWDVGGTGSVPAVLGAARFGLLTIGLTNDESKANALMVRGDKFDAIHDRSHSSSRASSILRHDELDRRLRGAQLPEEIRPRAKRRAVRQSRPGADHLAPSPRTMAISPACGRRIPTRSRKRPAPRSCAPARMPARSCRARWSSVPTTPRSSPKDVAKFLAVYLRSWGWAKANQAEARAPC